VNKVNFVSTAFNASTFEEIDWETEGAVSLTSSENAFRRDDREGHSVEHTNVLSPQVINTRTEPHSEDIHHASSITGFQHRTNKSLDTCVITPSYSAGQTRSHRHSSPALITTPSTAFSLQPSWPFANAHEARLFHHYIKHISPGVCFPEIWRPSFPLR
jgi:hypothetical protein